MAVAVAAAVAVGQGNTASAKEGFKAPTLENGVLTVEGTNAADAIALRESAAHRGVLQVDFGDDGTADFEFNLADLTQIIVGPGTATTRPHRRKQRRLQRHARRRSTAATV